MPMMPPPELTHDNRDVCCETAKQSSIQEHFMIHDRYPSGTGARRCEDLLHEEVHDGYLREQSSGKRW
jgi:hypothetical protein